MLKAPKPAEDPEAESGFSRRRPEIEEGRNHLFMHTSADGVGVLRVAQVFFR